MLAKKPNAAVEEATTINADAKKMYEILKRMEGEPDDEEEEFDDGDLDSDDEEFGNYLV